MCRKWWSSPVEEGRVPWAAFVSVNFAQAHTHIHTAADWNVQWAVWEHNMSVKWARLWGICAHPNSNDAGSGRKHLMRCLYSCFMRVHVFRIVWRNNHLKSRLWLKRDICPFLAFCFRTKKTFKKNCFQQNCTRADLPHHKAWSSSSPWPRGKRAGERYLLDLQWFIHARHAERSKRGTVVRVFFPLLLSHPPPSSPFTLTSAAERPCDMPLPFCVITKWPRAPAHALQTLLVWESQTSEALHTDNSFFFPLSTGTGHKQKCK